MAVRRLKIIGRRCFIWDDATAIFQFVELLGRCLRIESFVRGLLAAREALIKSLSDFILGFLCNARNSSTRIASYLRRAMTKQCIKILMKSDSAN